MTVHAGSSENIVYVLIGLGKQLRLLGVDVLIIADEDGDNHDEAVYISRREGRIILTAGKVDV